MYMLHPLSVFFFFFNDTATTEIYTLSLHDALPISAKGEHAHRRQVRGEVDHLGVGGGARQRVRSEEHTSELQSQSNLVCRLLLEKKKKKVLPTCKSCVTAECSRSMSIHLLSLSPRE